MNECEFNESTFATCITFELVNKLKKSGLKHAFPVIPTLRQEAKDGYDVAIPQHQGVLYLQFKIPVQMVGAQAGEYAAWKKPYYRFRLKTDPTKGGHIQHTQLVKLERAEKKKGAGGLVYYCAPAFVQKAEFQTHYDHDTISDNSLFALPSLQPTVKPRSRHHYTYQDPTSVIPFSTPGDASPGLLRSVLGEMLEVTGPQSPRTTLEEFIDGQVALLTELGPPRSDNGDRPDPDLPAGRSQEPLGRLFAAASALDLQPILVSRGAP